MVATTSGRKKTAGVTRRKPCYHLRPVTPAAAGRLYREVTGDSRSSRVAKCPYLATACARERTCSFS